jgi:ATP-binding cassette, subfamily A (ABC1), member 3
LGVNGGGKSTTIKMLTGDAVPTSGSATIMGADCTANASVVRGHIGYCPQHDPLLDLLTPRETLRMYALLKGYRGRSVDVVVEALVRMVDLTEAADRAAGALSGGNKRKLCVAVALVGGPRVLFLDEPSSGMDPVSQRQLWNTLVAITGGPPDTAPLIVLTSHSMQECAALCQLVGIMIKGQLTCLGPVPHLQARFGAALQVEVRAAPPTAADVAAAGAAIRAGDPPATVARPTQRAAVQAFLEGVLARLSPTAPPASLAAAMAADPTVLSVLSDTAALSAALAVWLRVSAVSHHVRTVTFPGAVVVEAHGVKVRLSVPQATSSDSAAADAAPPHADLSAAFDAMAAAQAHLARAGTPVEAYSISQVALEQIFNDMAAAAADATAAAAIGAQ